MKTPLPEDATLEQAKEWLRVRFNEGAECPCCLQHVKLYRRPITSSMAYVLILLHREPTSICGPLMHFSSGGLK